MSHLPLKNLKVLDLSRILAGPYASQILGDLGAHVIKIEKPDGGDDTRHWGPPFINTEEGQSAAYYYSANRNKKSLALNLKSDKDLSHLKDLITQADVVIENFKTGDTKRLTIDYESTQKINPQLIYCSITGFGQTGPYSHRTGYDALIQAMGGLMSITGPDSSTPIRTGVAITDITTGLYAVIGILAALKERESSGKGQHIDLSLFDTQVSWLANVGMNFLVSQKVPQAYGTAHPNIVPYQSFKCIDGLIYIAVGNDQQFKKMSESLDQSWHKENAWLTNADRVQNRESLIHEMQTLFEKKQKFELLKIFEEQQIPAGPINNLEDLKNDPHVTQKNLFTTMNESSIPCIKNPLNFSRTPIRNYKTPPHKAESNRFDFSIFKKETEV